jgi:hypothetical protein
MQSSHAMCRLTCSRPEATGKSSLATLAELLSPCKATPLPSYKSCSMSASLCCLGRLPQIRAARTSQGDLPVRPLTGRARASLHKAKLELTRRGHRQVILGYLDRLPSIATSLYATQCVPIGYLYCLSSTEMESYSIKRRTTTLEGCSMEHILIGLS